MGSSALPLNINTQMNQFVQQTTSNPINNNSNHNIYNNMGVPQQLAAGHMAIPTSTMMNSSNNHNSNVPNLWVHPVMQQQQQQPQPQPQVQPSALTSSMGPSLASQIETLIVQQTGLREQIRQSENNLQAQHSVNNSFYTHCVYLECGRGNDRSYSSDHIVLTAIDNSWTGFDWTLEWWWFPLLLF